MIRLVYDTQEAIKALEEFTRTHIKMGESNKHIFDQAKYNPDFYTSMTGPKIEETVKKVLKEQGKL
jgi:hypothetical protein